MGPGDKENLHKYADDHAACSAMSNNVIYFWRGESPVFCQQPRNFNLLTY